MSDGKIISNILLFAFNALIGYIIFIDDGKQYDFYVLLLSFIISEYCLFKLFKYSKYSFSLNNIVYLFTLFFFGIAPALQFKQNVVFWGAQNHLTIENYLFGNILILFILVFYDLGYSYFIKKIILQPNNKVKSKSIRSLKKLKFRWILLIISFFSLLIFLYSRDFNFLAMFFRGESEEIANSDHDMSQPLSLITTIFIRPLPLICLFVYKLYTKNKRINFFEIGLLIITLISNFPTGMSRNQAAALYIPLLLVYFKPLTRKFNFSLLFCLGMLIVFPFLNQFREVGSYEYKLKLDTEMFTEAHFDSYQNTMNVVKKETITNGNQIFGVFLFYIPRSLWPNKPIGSGAFFANLSEYDFSNISMSYFGEGYINAGYLGMFVFTLLIALFNAKFDYYFWESNRLNEKYILFYPFLLGMEFFILRGDLMSSFAYTIGLLTSVYFVFKIAVLLSKY